MAQNEIDEWKSTFNKYMNTNHELDLKAFQSAWKDQSLMHKMPEHLNYSPVLVIAVFNGFKEQHRSLDDYNLTLYEFLSGVYLVLHGSLEDQANHLFDVIDTDRNGRIDRNELSRAMEQRIHSIARLMPDLLKEQLKELVETDLDAQSIKVVEKGVQDGMHALQHMMEDVEKDIPMAVNQIFLEADLNQTDYLSLDEWLLIWKVRPELIDMMSINGMMKIIRWASAVGVQRDNTGSSTSERRRPDTRMKGAD